MWQVDDYIAMLFAPAKNVGTWALLQSLRLAVHSTGQALSKPERDVVMQSTLTSLGACSNLDVATPAELSGSLIRELQSAPCVPMITR